MFTQNNHIAFNSTQIEYSNALIDCDIIPIANNGECLLESMDLERKRESKELESGLARLEIRQLIAPEIEAAMLEGTLARLFENTDSQEELQLLQIRRLQIEEEKTSLLTRGKETSPKHATEKINDSLVLLRKHLETINDEEKHTGLIEEINNLQESYEEFRKDLHAFCLSQPVQEIFRSQFISKEGTWLSYQTNTTTSIDAIAELNNMHLLIFRPVEKK